MNKSNSCLVCFFFLVNVIRQFILKSLQVIISIVLLCKKLRMESNVLFNRPPNILVKHRKTLIGI